MKYPNSYVVFDFETTGLDPSNSKVLEIGAIKVMDGEIIDRLAMLIKWPGLMVPENIIGITGISQSIVDNEGVEPAAAKQALKSFIDNQILIGHNIYNFDLKFLEKFLDLTAAEVEKINRNFIDTAAHYKAELINAERRFNQPYNAWVDQVMGTKAFGIKFNLGLCCDRYKINTAAGQHRAMADVLLTNQLYRKMLLT